MGPDLKRLCEAAENAMRDLGMVVHEGDGRGVVTYVLFALRDPSEGLKDAMSDATAFPTQALYEAVDYILAGNVKA
jgi:hypothetical protein